MKLLFQSSDCSQEGQTYQNYSKTFLEENYTPALSLEEVSILLLIFCVFVSTCSSLLQKYLLVVLVLDIVLLHY